MKYIKVDNEYFIYNPNYRGNNLYGLPVLAIVNSKEEAEQYIADGYTEGMEAKNIIQFRKRS